MEKKSILKLGIKQIKNDLFDNLFFFYQLVFFTQNIRQFNTDIFLSINLLLIIILCLFKKRLVLNMYLFYLTLFYFGLTTFYSLIFGTDFVAMVGFYLRLLTAYFLIYYYKNKFFVFFENWIFLLAYISLFFFVIQITYPHFFDIFEKFSNLVLAEEVVLNGNFRYLLIYLLSNWGESISFRNSGFMSEPSAFASVLTWSILINVGINKFSYNKKLFIQIIALLTTFSIGGFMYLIVIFFLLFLNNAKTTKKSLPFFLMIFGLIIMFFVIKNTEIYRVNYDEISYKILNEEVNYRKIERNKVDQNSISRVNGALINFKEFLKFPFGYGYYSVSKYAGSSPNGFSVLLYRYGIFFLLICFYSAKNICKHLHLSWKDFKVSNILLMFLYIFPLSGFLFLNQPFIWVLLFYPIFIKVQNKDQLNYLQFYDK